MADLVKRLRMGTQVPEFELRQEAADEIERLQATVEHLQDTCKEKHDSMIAMMNEALAASLHLRAALGRVKKLEAAYERWDDVQAELDRRNKIARSRKKA